MDALHNNDIHFLVKNFSPSNHWRILEEYFKEISYFDVETTGLTRYDSVITVIVCFHKGRLYTYLRGENLNEFLDLLEDVALLASYNGNSFDLPFVLDSFHIPELPCPHIDLRWVCYHADLKGGLKAIEAKCGINRPVDLIGIDGFEAVYLWNKWLNEKDSDAKKKLIRYCQADVISLIYILQKTLSRYGVKNSPEDTINLYSMLLKG